MGDISAEPSMEEILSSIKRIIAEEGDGTPGRQRRGSRQAPPPTLPAEDDEDDGETAEILELSDPMPMSQRAPDPEPPVPPRPIAPPPAARAEPRRAAAPAPVELPAEPIVSRETVAATRGPLEALARMMVKPDPGSDGTLEGLVREMLRPMLREWLDANLPGMVEEMVAREIAKITGQPG